MPVFFFLPFVKGAIDAFMNDRALTDWHQLDAREQLQLREAYGHYLDTLPPTCDLEEKTARFRRWLAKRGIRYTSTR